MTAPNIRPPRELSEQEQRLIDELVSSGGFDAVLAAYVVGELKYMAPELPAEYIQASAWLMLARARQTAALKRIQQQTKGLQPHVAQALLVLWAAQAAEIAEQMLKKFSGKPTEDGAAPTG